MRKCQSGLCGNERVGSSLVLVSSSGAGELRPTRLSSRTESGVRHTKPATLSQPDTTLSEAEDRVSYSESIFGSPMMQIATHTVDTCISKRFL